MLFTDTAVALVAAVAFGATSVDATFRMSSRPLAYTRVDPLVNPKGVGGHVHDIRGGSRFRDILDSTEDMLKAKCTTMIFSPDKSNYWVPALYYINPNGTYTHLNGDVLIYYHNVAGKPNAFPNGLRMLTGLAMKRDIGSIHTQGILWSVNAHEQDPAKWPQPKEWNPKFLPNGTNVDVAPHKISAHAYFPSCGLADGTLDSEDHFSHMAWPVGEGGGKQWIQIGNSPNCPDTHPIKYPEVHIETFWTLTDWQRENWRKGEANLVLANGDTTGTTYHADFTNGWDGDILQKALEDDTCLNEDPDQCPPLQQYRQDDKFQDCRWEGQLVDEDVGLWTPIKQLPGCNPIWDWNGPVEKPKASGDQCTQEPGFVSPNVQLDIGYGFVLPQVFQNYNGTPSSLGGCDTPHKCPVFSHWGMNSKGENVSWAQVGTQAEVEANVVKNDKNSRMVIPGMQNESPYDAIKPTKTFGHGNRLAPTQILKMTTSIEYFCQHTSPYGMPCGPTAGSNDTARNAAATGTTAAGSPTAAPTGAPTAPAAGGAAAGGAAAGASSSTSTSPKPSATDSGPLNPVLVADPNGVKGTTTGPAAPPTTDSNQKPAPEAHKAEEPTTGKKKCRSRRRSIF